MRNARRMQRATRSMQHTSCNVQRAACSVRHATGNVQHGRATSNPRAASRSRRCARMPSPRGSQCGSHRCALLHCTALRCKHLNLSSSAPSACCAGVVWTALGARACTTARGGTGCTLSVSQQAAPTLRSQMRSCRWGSGGSRGGSAAVTEPRTSVPAALRGHPAASFLASGPSHLRGYPAASFRLKGFDSGTERVAHRGTHGRSAATPQAGRSCSRVLRPVDGFRVKRASKE